MSVKFQDYYETLGVPRDATPEEIKKAFRKKARLYHPDVAKDKASAEEKFKQVNEAYEVLSDPEKRKRFDQLGANWQQTGGPPPGYDFGSFGGDDGGFEFEGTGFSDFFERYFSGGQGGFRSSTRSPFSQGAYQRRGRDIEADILISLEDALHGSQRTLTLRRPPSGDGLARTETIKVKIPAGLLQGQRIRLAGKGGPGIGGAPPGDIYLEVRFASHPDFTVEGSDLHYDLDLAPWEAVLGTQVKVPTLDGHTTLKVAPHTETGTHLRLKGKGLPHANGHRGDLYAVVHIQVPTTSTAEEQSLWEKLREVSKFDPRS
jgi:curved DNA-binding protein